MKGAITTNQRRRVVELAKAGGITSLRGLEAALLAEGVKLSHVSCKAILAKAGVSLDKGSRVFAKRKGPARRRLPARGTKPGAAAPPDVEDCEPDAEDLAAAGDAADAERLDEVLEADRAFVEGALAMRLPEMPPLPADAPPSAVQAWCNLMDARSLLAAMRPKLVTGDVSYAAFKAALDSSIKAADALTARMPKGEADPAKDPTNMAAREMVRATVRRVVTAVELRAGRLCAACAKAVA